MRIIITGGSGLIGKAVAKSFAADGHDVIILTRGVSHQNSDTSIKFVKWDGKSSQDWLEYADGADAIINLAGENIANGNWSPERKRAILDSRINAAKAVVEAVERSAKKPSVLVQASAVGYYGVSAGDVVMTEEHAPGGDFLADVCVQWERASEPVESIGVRRVVIRTGVILSMDGGALPKILVPFRSFIGGPVGSGRQPFPWIHIADEVAAIKYLVMNKQCSGPYNLAAPQPLSNAQFAHILGKVMHRPSFSPVPALVLRTVLGEMATLLLTGQRAVPDKLTRSGFKFEFSDLEQALTNLLG